MLHPAGATVPATPAADLSAKVPIITCDAHVGPLLEEQLRDYCPQKYLDDFDGFVASVRVGMPREPELPDVESQPHLRNILSTGGWDMHERMREFDQDGISGEVVFHSLTTIGRFDPMPFNAFMAAFGAPGCSDELVGAGRHMYNRWLIDFLSVEPERHAGIAYLPMWDPEACVAEVEWAAANGLRGVFFPRPQTAILPYNDPAWDRFWAACADHGMPLTTHSQHDTPESDVDRPGDRLLSLLDVLGPWSRIGLQQLVFGGVFDRHPELRLVFTEQNDNWWATTLNLMDSVAKYGARELDLPRNRQIYDGPPYGMTKLGRLPSEYCHENVFIGWTCMAPFEATDAVEKGYSSQVMWGSDYPHPEGCWQRPRHPDEVSLTRLHLRDTFSKVSPERATAMVNTNAARLYGFDGEKLQAVADRINAPTLAELTSPLEQEPPGFLEREGVAKLCFRRNGPMD